MDNGFHVPSIPHPHDGRLPGSRGGRSVSTSQSSPTVADPEKPLTGFDHYAAHRMTQDWVNPKDAQAKAASYDRYRAEFSKLPSEHHQFWDDRANGRDLNQGYRDPTGGAALAMPAKAGTGLSTGTLSGGASDDRFAGKSTAAAAALAAAPSYVPTFAAPDKTTVDTQGNRHIDTGSGGTVDIPARQPQAPLDNTFGPANGQRTGIFGEDGKEVVATGTDPRGSTQFAPAQAPSLTLANTAQPPADSTTGFGLNTGQPQPDADALTRSMMDDDSDEFAGAMASGASTPAASTPAPSALQSGGLSTGALSTGSLSSGGLQTGGLQTGSLNSGTTTTPSAPAAPAVTNASPAPATTPAPKPPSLSLSSGQPGDKDSFAGGSGIFGSPAPVPAVAALDGGSSDPNQSRAVTNPNQDPSKWLDDLHVNLAKRKAATL